MEEFESNEDYEDFKKEFLSLASEMVESINSFEQNLKKHPLFCGMERYKEDYLYDLRKQPKNDIWNPTNATEFLDLAVKQIAYYSKCEDTPRSLRIVRAAFFLPEDAEKISSLKKKSEEIIKCIASIRPKISKWKAGYQKRS